MFPNEFEYVAPQTVDEAVTLLQQNPDAKLLAGGHSLLPLMKTRLASPPMLIDIGKIAELKGIESNGSLQIGALATYHEVAASAEVQSRCPILAEAIPLIGDAQVRNRGTMGGALAHADPAADMTAIVLALGGTIRARGPNGERTISIDDFFVDLLQTQLDHDEILLSITIPAMDGRVGMAYEKFKHPASGYAVVGVAAVVRLADDGTVADVRVGVTGAGAIAKRATATEDALRGQTPSAEQIQRATSHAADGIELLGDLTASEEYRAHLVRVYARRALTRAVEGA
jgi:aerobic carbon-monoxide dehydrogenase medium subunit